MWQLLLTTAAILGIIRDTLTKRITQKIDPLVALFYFYITAVGTAILISFAVFNTNPLVFDRVHWLARLFGISFGIGVYGLFSAIKINLTKTQTFANYRNLISILLAYFILGEIRQVSIYSILALIIFITSLVLPVIINNKSSQEDKLTKEWIFWMSLNIVFVGSGLFFVKMFTKSLLPIDLLVNQYLGSFFIVCLILYFRRKSIIVTDKATMNLTLLNGVITALSLFFLYQSISLGQVSIVTQVDNFIRTILIVPIGLIVFKEYKSMKTIDYVSLALALVGAFLLLFFVK